MKPRPLIINDDHILVPLTQGQFAIVDLEDRHIVEGWNWYADYCRRGERFYAKRKITVAKGKQTRVNMHREILKPAYDLQVDHVDGNGLNNRRSNLREATNQQNMQNSGLQRNNKSGFIGVHRENERKKWRAQISVNGKRTMLGRFRAPEDAARAYDEVAKQYYGHFAVLNFPQEGDMT